MNASTQNPNSDPNTGRHATSPLSGDDTRRPRAEYRRTWWLLVAFGVCLLVAATAGSLITAAVGAHTQPAPPVASQTAAQAAAPVVSPGGQVLSYAPIVKPATRSVVNIASSKTVKNQEAANNPMFNDPFFRRFFGDDFGPNMVPRERREQSLGSGVIVDPRGYILTNNHVIAGANSIKVFLPDKQELIAHLVGADPKTDIAVLKVDTSNLPALPLGNSSSVEVGDVVFAIGDPFGLGQTVTMGIVSATGRGNLGIEDYEDFIQTDAAINPGNSGGALIDAHGELIGINTAILSNGVEGNQGVGFAVPINMARQVMDQIIAHGKVVRGWLGVVIQPVSPEMAQAFGLPEAKGALVGDVMADSPAAHAGLAKGDVIVALNGQPVIESRSLQLKIAQLAPGTKIQLEILRDGKTRTIDATLGSQPGNTAEEEGSQEKTAILDGLTVDQLTPQIARQLNLPSDAHGVVVVQVDPGSPAGDAGLQRGDVIQEVNRKPVYNVKGFDDTVRQGGNRPVLLLVNRGGNTFFVVVEAQ
jgi:serine protease Do